MNCQIWELHPETWFENINTAIIGKYYWVAFMRILRDTLLVKILFTGTCFEKTFYYCLVCCPTSRHVSFVRDFFLVLIGHVELRLELRWCFVLNWTMRLILGAVSWNLRISFFRPGRQWKLIVGHGKSCKIEAIFGTFSYCRCQSKIKTSNKPFPSCPKPLFESEVKCEVIDMKTFFHKKGFGQRLVFEVRVFGTHKWPINSVNGMHFGRHQSMCLFVSELNTKINKNKNSFEHFRKWPLNLRSWKTGKVRGKSHGTWRAQTNTNPSVINTKKRR